MSKSPKPEPTAPGKPDGAYRAPDGKVHVRKGGEETFLAAFTPKELDTLRTVCRDSDNELGIRALNAALARGGK